MIIFFITNIKFGIVKIKDDTEYVISEDQAYSLNYDNGYVYYTSPNSNGGIDIKKLSHNGDTTETLKSTSSSTTKVYLKDGYLYYVTTSPNTISKIDVNGENEEVVINREVLDFEVEDENIYFTTIAGILCSIDLNGNNYTEISEENLDGKFQIYDGNAYYYKEDEGIMKMNLKNGNTDLISDKVNSDIYNVTNKGIFFLDVENMKICKIGLNGKSYTELTSVNTSNTKINVVNNVLYYYMLEDNNYKTYRIKINGKEAEEIEY